MSGGALSALDGAFLLFATGITPDAGDDRSPGSRGSEFPKSAKSTQSQKGK